MAGLFGLTGRADTGYWYILVVLLVMRTSAVKRTPVGARILYRRDQKSEDKVKGCRRVLKWWEVWHTMASSYSLPSILRLSFMTEMDCWWLSSPISKMSSSARQPKISWGVRREM